jgi:hypothetical protein
VHTSIRRCALDPALNHVTVDSDQLYLVVDSTYQLARWRPIVNWVLYIPHGIWRAGGPPATPRNEDVCHYRFLTCGSIIQAVNVPW